MLLQRIIISLSLLLLLGGNSLAETSPSRASVKGPITVTSESLTSDNKAHTALFEKNVMVRTPDMSMAADKMLIFYKEDGGEVTKIEATGNVRLIKESRIITSQNAIYYADEDKVVFTGEPKAVDGDNVVTGSKMTYLIKDDRSRVENSKVFLKNKRDK